MNSNDIKSLMELFTQGQTDEELLLNSIQTDIAATISAARASKGLSQKDLAQNLGVTQALVSKWENGESNYTISTLVRIALALGIEVCSPFEPLHRPYVAVSSPNIIPFKDSWSNFRSYEKSWAGAKTESSRELMEM